MRKIQKRKMRFLLERHVTTALNTTQLDTFILRELLFVIKIYEKLLQRDIKIRFRREIALVKTYFIIFQILHT